MYRVILAFLFFLQSTVIYQQCEKKQANRCTATTCHQLIRLLWLLCKETHPADMAQRRPFSIKDILTCHGRKSTDVNNKPALSLQVNMSNVKKVY